MPCQNPGCIGNYDFDHIAFYARKRFVEGIATIVLLANAINEREKEEIALVSLLDVEDDEIRDLQLCCKHAGRCKAINCRHKLKLMITKELARYHNS
jgi:hypothetical protein